jgi:hypothetical protein
VQRIYGSQKRRKGRINRERKGEGRECVEKKKMKRRTET